MTSNVLTTKVLSAVVLVTGFGFFVDMYDFFLFSAVRVTSLTELGLADATLTTTGIHITYAQMAGFLIGAYVWGVLGDRYGRKKCLLASILTYSIALLGCSFLHSVDQYMLARFAAGFGLAGELGVGVTLIAESLAATRRGYGMMLFMVLGFLGVVTAAIAAEFLYWRNAYLVGAIAGFVLLLARSWLLESGLFERRRDEAVVRGGLRLILTRPDLRRQYLAILFLLAPSTFIPQIMWALSPEIGKAMGLTEVIRAPVTLGIGFLFCTLVSLLAQSISERLQSRRRAALLFLVMGVASVATYFSVSITTSTGFYVLNALMGLTFGAWMMMINVAAEQFGTNLRATATTTLPNFSRGLTIPMFMAFTALKPSGTLFAVGVVASVVFLLAFAGWYCLRETYGKDLDYVER